MLADPLHDTLGHHKLIPLEAHVGQPLDQFLQQVQPGTPSGDPLQQHPIRRVTQSTNSTAPRDAETTKRQTIETTDNRPPQVRASASRATPAP
jgi:hypothetical protein